MSTRRNHKAATLKDVARAANVHVSTASRALDSTKSWRISEETVRRVKEAAETLGYVPDSIAQGLKRGTTTMVGVVVADLENPFFAPLIRGVSERLQDRGFVTLIAETLEDPVRFERTLNHLLSRRVNACITSAARTSDQHIVERFAERIPACILVVRNIEGSGLPYVIQDDWHGAELAARHLIDLDHRILAQLRGPDEIDVFRNRSEGFRRTVGAAGCVDVTISESAKGLTLQEGRRLMSRTLDENKQNPPTAVFAHADVMAIGAIEELEARGLRCPEDVSVIGYDDAPMSSHIMPPLSTIELPGEEIGRHAGDMAAELIDNPDSKPESVTVPARLIARESTGPAPRR